MKTENEDVEQKTGEKSAGDVGAGAGVGATAAKKRSLSGKSGKSVQSVDGEKPRTRSVLQLPSSLGTKALVVSSNE